MLTMRFREIGYREIFLARLLRRALSQSLPCNSIIIFLEQEYQGLDYVVQGLSVSDTKKIYIYK